MFALLVGAQLLVLIAMVAVSAWGRKHIDEETRIPARFGNPPAFDYTMSKKTSLIYTPLIGLLIFISTLAVRDTGTPEAVAAIGLAIMVFFLLAHRSSVRRAAR